MHLKVHDGTASNGDSNLCATCRLSTIVRGRTLDEEIVQCHALSMRSTRVTFKVTYCSAYSDARRPSYLQMVEHAWILQPGSKKKTHYDRAWVVAYAVYGIRNGRRESVYEKRGLIIVGGDHETDRRGRRRPVRA